MTSGEGGAIVCRSAEDASWYRSARHHGISKNASSRYTKEYQHWDMEMMGWKYNMDDVQAAILIGQVERIDSYRQKRQFIERLYRELLKGIDELDFIEAPGANEISGHHLFTVLLPRKSSRDETLHKLQQAGIGCAVNYRAVHTLTYFQQTYGYRPDDFPVANDIGKRTISLPLYPELTEKEVRFVCKNLKEAITVKCQHSLKR
jgi:dTDP-4-amino-4,6-dideoxygalactose transaminase